MKVVSLNHFCILSRSFYCSEKSCFDLHIPGCPQKGFGELGSAVCVQRDRYIEYIVSKTADLTSVNQFQGQHPIF